MQYLLAGMQVRYDHMELWSHDGRRVKDCHEKMSELESSNRYQRKLVSELKVKISELTAQLKFDSGVHFKENCLANKEANRMQTRINELQGLNDKLKTM